MSETTNIEIQRAWNAGKTKKPEKFGVKLPLGNFIAQVQAAKKDKTKGKGIDRVTFTLVVTEPNETEDGIKVAGKQEYVSYLLQNRTFGNGNAVTVAETTQRVIDDLYNMGIDPSETNSLEEALALVTQRKPKVKIFVGEGQKSGKKFLAINEPAEPLLADANVPPEAPFDGGGQIDNVDGGDSGNIDEPWAPNRGEKYLFPDDDTGVPHEVKRVSRTNQTVVLVNVESGDEMKDVAWDDLGPDYYGTEGS